MGETTYESVSVSVCERDGEKRASGSALIHVIETLIKLILCTPSSPPPQSASTHRHNTPVLRGSRPITTFVHCYSNHGAHWGAHHVAMETASVYNVWKKKRESRIDPYGEITCSVVILSVIVDASQMLSYLQIMYSSLLLFNEPSKWSFPVEKLKWR